MTVGPAGKAAMATETATRPSNHVSRNSRGRETQTKVFKVTCTRKRTRQAAGGKRVNCACLGK